ncbi:hypothetical protein F5Y04DRAFT_58836 [Hypomontagnella monticulosa]|nr:hypothetical protein F5Y04DRAFT_58836 [Hypomontagnella monticulosa]
MSTKTFEDGLEGFNSEKIAEKQASTSSPAMPSLGISKLDKRHTEDELGKTHDLRDDQTPSRSGPKHSLFLTLPVEIRLEIFAHLLIIPASAPPPSQYQQHFPVHRLSSSSSTPSLLHPAILRTCKQLHAEALPLLYQRNTFLAHNALLTTLPRLRRIYPPVVSARLAGLITRFHVCVRLDASPGYDGAAVAAQLSGKEEVVLEAWQAMWRGSGPDVLRLFEGVRGVRRARVVGSVSGFEEYASWLEKAMMREVGARVEPFPWDAEREGQGDLDW